MDNKKRDSGDDDICDELRGATPASSSASSGSKAPETANAATPAAWPDGGAGYAALDGYYHSIPSQITRNTYKKQKLRTGGAFVFWTIEKGPGVTGAFSFSTYTS